jgi:hypothetical protein
MLQDFEAVDVGIGEQMVLHEYEAVNVARILSSSCCSNTKLLPCQEYKAVGVEGI